MVKNILVRPILPLIPLLGFVVSAMAAEPSATKPAQSPSQDEQIAIGDLSDSGPSLIFKVEGASSHLQMTVHTSRIIMIEKKIQQVNVHNPDVLGVSALAPNQIQVAAKTTGVTQINLWDENQKEYIINVIVFGDAKELQMILRSTFPTAALKVTPLAKSVLITGFVDKPEHINRIVRIAEEYFPTVINNMTVGGVQQVLLHVKMMEVSRTKLRQFGMDWANISGTQGVTTGISDLLSNTASGSALSVSGGSGTMAFTVGKSFLGVLDALREDKLMKILAEPTLTTISGRPAQFLSGGSFYIVPQGLAAAQPIKVNFGTQLDFLPIVLGNGRIHLDVRPHVSQIDDSLTVQGYPGLTEQMTETGVELQAGQTLAIAGLVQSRISGKNHGLPWISELPYIGAAFRTVKEEVNDVELLVMVTPEVVEPLDANEVPQCGPGMQTTSPSDWELYLKGHIEVPKCCPANKTANGDLPQSGNGSNLPPDGMIQGSGETVPSPPTDTTRNSTQKGAVATVASRTSQKRINLSTDYNRYNTTGANTDSSASSAGNNGNPPGLIGPAGYDVVK